MTEPKINEKVWELKHEPELISHWHKAGTYKFDSNSEKSIFSIDTPPPYPSGRPWHIGAAAHYSQIDMIARTSRMLNKEVFFPIGIDRNGLPVEIYTEKKYNISMRNTPREKFIEYCRTALDDLETEMLGIMKRMGLSGDFDHHYRTDSEEYHTLTQSTFIDLWKKGLIYEDTRPNNYCIKCCTTIADAEVEYQELHTKLNYIKFNVKGSKKELTIATTRPELLGACAAILYNPDDERYKKLKGTAIVPIYNHEVPIMAHPYAKSEFGTGLVMICSYGDYGDVRLFRELKLKEKILIDISGRMNKASGKYESMKIDEARDSILKDLKSANLLIKQEDIIHNTPICERSKTPIEIILMKEYYLKQINFLDTIKNYAHEMHFYPEQYRQNLINWIDSVSMDWPITRRRIYGTEVPVWYCKKCNKSYVPEPGKYYQPWKEKAPFEKCSCGSTEFVGDERTFDMWMDSGISPLFVSGYLKDNSLFKKTFPVSIRPQAKDIIRTWLYYTLLRVHQLTGKCAFHSVWVMGHGVDEHGEKMSKSKGNVVDPIPILEKYGADAFRFWNASEASLGEDFRFSNSRIEYARKFLTKLWNISRFISSFPIEKTESVEDSDKWVLAELNNMIKKSVEGYETFNFFIPANAAKQFMWSIFADNYLELVKGRVYKGDKAACYTLHTCLKAILKLLAPICPFITEKIWLELYSKESIHKERLPEVSTLGVVKYLDYTQMLIDLNSTIWKYKKDKGLSLNSELKEVYVKQEFKLFEEDLKLMHNIKTLKFEELTDKKGNITKFENVSILE